jgi:hypothetical protein
MKPRTVAGEAGVDSGIYTRTKYGRKQHSFAQLRCRKAHMIQRHSTHTNTTTALHAAPLQEYQSPHRQL